MLSIGYIAEPSIVIICKCRYVLMNSSNNEVTDYMSVFLFLCIGNGFIEEFSIDEFKTYWFLKSIFRL